MRQFSAVIFDGDGVVFDSEHLSIETFRRMMQRHGLDFSVGDCAPFIGLSTRGILDFLRQAKGLDLDEGAYVEAREELYEQLCRETAGPGLMPGICELLDLLDQAGVPWGMATSGSPRKVAFNLASTDLAHRFLVCVTGCQVPRGKPHPDVFLEVARRLDVQPEACAVVEDSINGLRGARAAGMVAIAMAGSHPNHELMPHADCLFATPGDLARWLTAQTWVKTCIASRG